MAEPPTTSKLRQHTIAAITSAAGRDPAAAALLGHELEFLSYERRTDGDLIDLAERVGVPEARRTELAMLDPTRVPEHATALCPVCFDTQSVDRGDGRFERCPACNPEPPREEPE